MCNLQHNILLATQTASQYVLNEHLENKLVSVQEDIHMNDKNTCHMLNIQSKHTKQWSFTSIDIRAVLENIPYRQSQLT